jgi:hypothetical protein
MLKPCLGCGGLTRTGSYCPRSCPPESPGKERSGGRLATFRRKTLARYGLRCIVRQHPGSPDYPIEAAHDLGLDMTPGQQASFEECESGVSLCRRCHREIDTAMRRAQRRRMG